MRLAKRVVEVRANQRIPFPVNALQNYGLGKLFLRDERAHFSCNPYPSNILMGNKLSYFKFSQSLTFPSSLLYLPSPRYYSSKPEENLPSNQSSNLPSNTPTNPPEENKEGLEIGEVKIEEKKESEEVDPKYIFGALSSPNPTVYTPEDAKQVGEIMRLYEAWLKLTMTYQVFGINIPLIPLLYLALILVFFLLIEYKKKTLVSVMETSSEYLTHYPHVIHSKPMKDTKDRGEAYQVYREGDFHIYTPDFDINYHLKEMGFQLSSSLLFTYIITNYNTKRRLRQFFLFNPDVFAAYAPKNSTEVPPIVSNPIAHRHSLLASLTVFGISCLIYLLKLSTQYNYNSKNLPYSAISFPILRYSFPYPFQSNVNPSISLPQSQTPAATKIVPPPSPSSRFQKKRVGDDTWDITSIDNGSKTNLIFTQRDWQNFLSVQNSELNTDFFMWLILLGLGTLSYTISFSKPIVIPYLSSLIFAKIITPYPPQVHVTTLHYRPLSDPLHTYYIHDMETTTIPYELLGKFERYHYNYDAIEEDLKKEEIIDEESL